jgi:hypothetical protein
MQVPCHEPNMTLAMRNLGVGCSALLLLQELHWYGAHGTAISVYGLYICLFWWSSSSLDCQSACLWDCIACMTMSSAAACHVQISKDKFLYRLTVGSLRQTKLLRQSIQPHILPASHSFIF